MSSHLLSDMMSSPKVIFRFWGNGELRRSGLLEMRLCDGTAADPIPQKRYSWAEGPAVTLPDLVTPLSEALISCFPQSHTNVTSADISLTLDQVAAQWQFQECERASVLQQADSVSERHTVSSDHSVPRQEAPPAPARPALPPLLDPQGPQGLGCRLMKEI